MLAKIAKATAMVAPEEMYDLECVMEFICEECSRFDLPNFAPLSLMSLKNDFLRA